MSWYRRSGSHIDDPVVALSLSPLLLKHARNRFLDRAYLVAGGMVCVYIYIYAVKLLTGPRLAILIVTNWGHVNSY